MKEADRADFERLFIPAIGPLSSLPKDMHGRLLEPAKAKKIIENWLRVGQENYQAEQEMGQFLTQVRTHPSYLSLTAEDWAAFDYELNEGTGKFSLSYTENQRPALRMTKIKEWLADPQADRQAFNEMKRFLANVEAHPQFLSLKAEDWAAFDYELTGTGSLSTSYTENRRPAVRMAKIKAWLEARQADRQAEQEMDLFLTQVRTHASYLSLTAEDWAAFDYELNEETGKFSLSYTENQRPAKRMAKIKAWLDARQADRQAFNEMKRFLANVEAHPQFLSLKAEDWAAFDYELTGTGSLSTSYTENQRPAVRMAKIRAWLEARRLAR